MARLKILGTGGFRNEGLPFNAWLLDGVSRSGVSPSRASQGEAGILVDCPPDILQSLAREGVDLDSLGTVVLTHFHGDHCFGLPFLLFNLAARGERPLTIAGPSPGGAYGLHGGLRAKIRDLLSVAISPGSPYIGWFDRNVETVETGEDLRLERGGFWLRFLPTEHPVPTFGILAGLAGEDTPRLAATSDTSAGDRAAAFFASGAKLVLCDANGGPVPSIHMSPEEAASLARTVAPAGTRIVGTHLSRTPQDAVEGIEFAVPGAEYRL